MGRAHRARARQPVENHHAAGKVAEVAGGGVPIVGVTYEALDIEAAGPLSRAAEALGVPPMYVHKGLSVDSRARQGKGGTRTGEDRRDLVTNFA